MQQGRNLSDDGHGWNGICGVGGGEVIENVGHVCKVLWRLAVGAIKSVGNFIMFILLLPIVFVMLMVLSVYAFVEMVKLWITQTFKPEEQRI
jgi:hypothetical protein